MNYFVLQPASGTEETGMQFPQVQKMTSGYHYKTQNSIHALSRARKAFPDFVPNLNYPVLHSQAKLTDLLSIAIINAGFLISRKFKNLFDQFHLVSHKYYPLTLMHKNSLIENYYWMHIISDFTSIVDYPQSDFFIYYNYSENLGNVTISSMEDLVLKERELKQNNPGKLLAIWAEKIKFNSSFDATLDLFKISKFDGNYYISERLKNEITKEKISGCNIYPAANLAN